MILSRSSPPPRVLNGFYRCLRCIIRHHDLPHSRREHGSICLTRSSKTDVPHLDPTIRDRNNCAHPSSFFGSSPDAPLHEKHVSVNFTRIIKAFIIYRNEPGGPAAFFNRLSEFTQMFGSTLYVAQTLLGDALVVSCANAKPLNSLLIHWQIWRCYLAWDKNIFVVAFPLLLLLGSTGMMLQYPVNTICRQETLIHSGSDRHRNPLLL